MNFNSEQKNFDGDKVAEILWLHVGDILVTDTSGAEFLTGFSTSNVSKICRPSKNDNGDVVAAKVVSQKQGKGRFIEVASLKAYFESERRAPGLQSKLNDINAKYIAMLPEKAQKAYALELAECAKVHKAS